MTITCHGKQALYEEYLVFLWVRNACTYRLCYATLILERTLLIERINNFWGDLSNVTAKTKALLVTCIISYRFGMNPR